VKDGQTVEAATVLNDRVTHLTINLTDLLSVKLISQIALGQLGLSESRVKRTVKEEMFFCFFTTT